MKFSILQETGFVPSSFPGFWTCLSTLLALCSIILSCSGQSSGACLPTLWASCSIILSWLELVSLSLFWNPVPAGVPELVSLLFWHPVPSSFPSNSGLSFYFFGKSVLLLFPGSGAGLPTILSWFRVAFRDLSPCTFPFLFHHHFLVPAGFQGLPTLLASCSIIISWFRLEFRGLSSYLLAFCSIIMTCFNPKRSGVEWGSQLFQETGLFHLDFLVLGIRAFCSTIISLILLVLGKVPVIRFLAFWHSVSFSFPGSIRVLGVVSLVFWHSVLWDLSF